MRVFYMAEDAETQLIEKIKKNLNDLLYNWTNLQILRATAFDLRITIY